MFGPAVNPSRDIATSSTILLIASLLRSIGAAVRRHHENVGADLAVLTSAAARSELLCGNMSDVSATDPDPAGYQTAQARNRPSASRTRPTANARPETAARGRLE